jgi:CheY-like chemotaxis protein
MQIHPVKNKRILIVDDDALIRKVIRIHLKSNYQVDEAETGEKAIAKSKENSFDAILMDISMKGMDGLQTTIAIRKIPSYKKTPIVAVTAHCFSNDRESFITAGCSHYLSKPFDKKDLIKLLDDIL